MTFKALIACDANGCCKEAKQTMNSEVCDVDC